MKKMKLNETKCRTNICFDCNQYDCPANDQYVDDVEWMNPFGSFDFYYDPYIDDPDPISESEE